MKKKILCLTLSVLFVFGFLFVGCRKGDSSSDVKKSEVTIAVGSAEAKVGDTVKLPVTIKNNPGIMAMLIDFKFDSECLQFVGFEKGEIFSDYETSDAKGVVRLMCVENEDVKGDGEIINLEFKVIGDKSSKTKVEVALEENSICNYDEELLPSKGKNGTVTIKK